MWRTKGLLLLGACCALRDREDVIICTRTANHDLGER